MKALTVYIAGPISGYPNSNIESFQSAAAFVASRGHLPLIPHNIPPWRHTGPCPPGYDQDGEHTSACYLRGDFVMLLNCTAIYMLRGWERSRGGSLEHRIAVEIGLPLFYENGAGTELPMINRGPELLNPFDEDVELEWRDA